MPWRGRVLGKVDDTVGFCAQSGKVHGSNRAGFRSAEMTIAQTGAAAQGFPAEPDKFRELILNLERVVWNALDFNTRPEEE